MAYTFGRTVLLSCPGTDVLFAPCDDGTLVNRQSRCIMLLLVVWLPLCAL